MLTWGVSDTCQMIESKREKAIRWVSLDFHILDYFKKQSFSRKKENLLGPLLDKLFKGQGEFTCSLIDIPGRYSQNLVASVRTSHSIRVVMVRTQLHATLYELFGPWSCSYDFLYSFLFPENLESAYWLCNEKNPIEKIDSRSINSNNWPHRASLSLFSRLLPWNL